MSRATRGPGNGRRAGAKLAEVRLKVRASGRHPWFYRKMIQKPKEPLPAGGAVKVRDRDGRLVGTGFYNPRAELALRMFADGEVRQLQRSQKQNRQCGHRSPIAETDLDTRCISAGTSEVIGTEGVRLRSSTL